MLRKIKLYGTTDASGDLVVTAGNAVFGLLHAVEWIDGAFADGVDAVLSVDRDDNAADVTLLTLTDANSDKVYYPVILVQDSAGADIASNYTQQVVNGKLVLTVSSGGASKAGGAIVYVSED